MFIKKTTKKDRKTGKTYWAFHLVESIRVEKGPRQRILLYMGSDLGLPEAEHGQLAQCISELLAGIQRLIPHPEHIERIAQGYVSQMVHRLSTQDCPTETVPKEWVTLDAHSIENTEPRSVGAEHLMLQMAQQLELPKQFAKLGLSKTQIATALATVIARAVHPESERSTHTWLQSVSGLGELLDFDFKKTSLHNLYKISDELLAHKAVLERDLERIERGYHGYTPTIALYDMTNVYMEGQSKRNPKAKFGRSKEKRHDCPLITLGLVMNEHGFLNGTSILSGNASEPKTLEKMITRLSAHQSLFKPVIILDAGIATEENLLWLRENGYCYVVSARQDAPSLELDEELVSVGDASESVRAARIKQASDSKERWLYCESEDKAAVASEMKQAFKKRFEDDLNKISVSLFKSKRKKNYQKMVERIGRLKERHKQISGCYQVEVEADGEFAASIRWKAIEEKLSEKLTGIYFLRTNLLDVGAKELWQLYNTLRRIEDAFRFMKSSLGIRPIYHQLEHRVDGHFWITILAYHLIQQCLYQLKKQGIHYEWKTIRNIMYPRVRVTMQAKLENGSTLYLRSTTKAEGNQLEIYKALGLSPQILGTRKTILQM